MVYGRAPTGLKFPKPVWKGTACFWETGTLGQTNRTIARLSVGPTRDTLPERA